MATKHRILISPDGRRLRFIHDDSLAGLLAAGRPRIARASNVEPTPEGQWEADLSPVGGPCLGPFPLRAEALSAEREWLLAHHLIPEDKNDAASC